MEGNADQDFDGKITIDELYDYAYEQVVRHTPKQTPGKWSYKQQGEIFLRDNLRPKDVKPAPLPADLLELLEHQNSSVRRAAVQDLLGLMDGSHLGLARAAQEKLHEVAENDDSLTLRKIAVQGLTAHGVATIESAPVEIPREKPVERSAPPPSKPVSAKRSEIPAASAVPAATVIKDLNPLPKLMQWKTSFPKLNKRLVGGFMGITLGIVAIVGAGRLIFNGGGIPDSTPTATATLTRRSTSTPAFTATITSTFTYTVSPTPTQTSEPTSTLTATATPTRTLMPFFTAKPTKKKGGGSGPTAPPPP